MAPPAAHSSRLSHLSALSLLQSLLSGDSYSLRPQGPVGQDSTGSHAAVQPLERGGVGADGWRAGRACCLWFGFSAGIWRWTLPKASARRRGGGGAVVTQSVPAPCSVLVLEKLRFLPVF